MTPPDDTPPKWLQPNSHRPGYLRMADEMIDLCETQGNDGDRTLPEWLAWRSRVATALGLVPREEMLAAIDRDIEAELKQEAFVIAAELRRCAGLLSGNGGRVEQLEREEMGEFTAGFRNARDATAEWLRARADELDPP